MRDLTLSLPESRFYKVADPSKGYYWIIQVDGEEYKILGLLNKGIIHDQTKIFYYYKNNTVYPLRTFKDVIEYKTKLGFVVTEIEFKDAMADMI